MTNEQLKVYANTYADYVCGKKTQLEFDLVAALIKSHAKETL